MEAFSVPTPEIQVPEPLVLRTENLVKQYGKRTVVNGVSFDVKQGEIVGLLGPNGAGKTTSFYMTTGLVVPNGGRIFLGDEEITKYPVFKRAKALVPIFIPLFVNSFRRAYELAFAMECRCYNGNNKRTRMKQMKFSWRDAVAFLLVAVMLAGIILLNYFFGAVI